MGERMHDCRNARYLRVCGSCDKDVSEGLLCKVSICVCKECVEKHTESVEERLSREERLEEELRIYERTIEDLKQRLEEAIREKLALEGKSQMLSRKLEETIADLEGKTSSYEKQLMDEIAEKKAIAKEKVDLEEKIEEYRRQQRGFSGFGCEDFSSRLSQQLLRAVHLLSPTSLSSNWADRKTHKMVRKLLEINIEPVNIRSISKAYFHACSLLGKHPAISQLEIQLITRLRKNVQSGLSFIISLKAIIKSVQRDASAAEFVGRLLLDENHFDSIVETVTFLTQTFQFSPATLCSFGTSLLDFLMDSPSDIGWISVLAYLPKDENLSAKMLNRFSDAQFRPVFVQVMEILATFHHWELQLNVISKICEITQIDTLRSLLTEVIAYAKLSSPNEQQSVDGLEILLQGNESIGPTTIFFKELLKGSVVAHTILQLILENKSSKVIPEFVFTFMTFHCESFDSDIEEKILFALVQCENVEIWDEHAKSTVKVLTSTQKTNIDELKRLFVEIIRIITESQNPTSELIDFLMQKLKSSDEMIRKVLITNLTSIAFLMKLNQELFSNPAFEAAFQLVSLLLKTESRLNNIQNWSVIISRIPVSDAESLFKSLFTHLKDNSDAFRFLQALFDFLITEQGSLIAAVQSSSNILGNYEFIDNFKEIISVSSAISTQCWKLAATIQSRPIFNICKLLFDLSRHFNDFTFSEGFITAIKRGENTTELILSLVQLSDIAREHAVSRIVTMEICDMFATPNPQRIDLLCSIPKLLVHLTTKLDPDIALICYRRILKESILSDNRAVLLLLKRLLLEGQLHDFESLLVSEAADNLSLQQVEDLYARHSTLPAIRNGHIRFFNCIQNKWQRQQLINPEFRTHEGMEYILLTNWTVLCCGGSNLHSDTGMPNGYQYWPDTHLILSNGTAQRQRDLIAGRDRHGLLYYPAKDSVYAFGGN